MNVKLSGGDDVVGIYNFVGIFGMVLIVGGVCMVVMFYLNFFVDDLDVV